MPRFESAGQARLSEVSSWHQIHLFESYCVSGVVGLNGSTTLYVFAITLYNSMYLICYARYLAAIKAYLLSFVETPRKFIIAELSIRKFGSSSVLIIRLFEFTRPFLYIKCRYCMLA